MFARTAGDIEHGTAARVDPSQQIHQVAGLCRVILDARVDQVIELGGFAEHLEWTGVAAASRIALKLQRAEGKGVMQYLTRAVILGRHKRHETIAVEESALGPILTWRLSQFESLSDPQPHRGTFSPWSTPCDLAFATLASPASPSPRSAPRYRDNHHRRTKP